MSNPVNTAQIGRGVLAVLRRAKSIKNASDEERSALLEDAEALEHQCAWLVLSAIVLEVVAWVSPLDPPFFKAGNAISDAFVAIGILGEMHFGQVVGNIMKTMLAEAVERAANADLARIELEKQLRGRSLTKVQYEALAKIKGQISEIRIASDADPEPMWFAAVVGMALKNFGITVHLLPRDAAAKSGANLFCDKRAFNPSQGEPTYGEPFATIFRDAGIPVGVLGGYPGDLQGEWGEDVPLLIIGNKVFPPEPPYLGEGLAAAGVPPL